MSTSSEALTALHDYLYALHLAMMRDEHVGDYTPEDEAAVSLLLMGADGYLTGKCRAGVGQYKRAAQRVLDGETEVLHLADGGYSRLGVSFVEEPFLWMDQGISLPRAVRNWNAWRAG
jgi:hypothetical protein